MTYKYFTPADIEQAQTEDKVREIGDELIEGIFENSDYRFIRNNRIAFGVRNLEPERFGIVEIEADSNMSGEYVLGLMAIYSTPAPVLPPSMEVDPNELLDPDNKEGIEIKEIMVSLNLNYITTPDSLEEITAVVRTSIQGSENDG